MPSFRLTRSSNRPQPALIEQQQQQQQQQAAGPPPPSTASTATTATAPGAGTVGVGPIDGNRSAADLPSNKTNPPPSALSAVPPQSLWSGPQQPLASASESSSFDSRQGPLPPALHQQGQGAQGPLPPHSQHRGPLEHQQRQQTQPREESDLQSESQQFPLRPYAPDTAGDNPKPALHPRSFSSLDNRRDYADHADTDTSSSHTPSHRYSAVFPQQFTPLSHHQHSHSQQHHRQPLHPQDYGFASSSVDDLHSAASYRQSAVPAAPAPPPAQEKRSTRKFIKDILLGSSSRSAHDNTHHHHNHHQHQQYHGRNNGTQDSQPPHAHRPNVIRKSSRRTSGPPNVTTNFSHPTSKPNSPQDWTRQNPNSYNGQQASPLHGLGEVDEQRYLEHDPNRQFRPADLDPSANTTIRTVPSDAEPSHYDDALYGQQQQEELPHQILQPAPLRHTQQAPHDDRLQSEQLDSQHPDPNKQHHFYDDGGYDQDYDQNHLQHPSGLPVSSHSHLGPDRTSITTASDDPIPDSRQYSSESVSQVSHESPSLDSDQRSIHQPSPIAGYPGTQPQDLARTASPATFEQTTSYSQQSVMAPPGGGQQQNIRRTQGQAQSQSQAQSQAQAQAQSQAQAQAQAQDTERILRGIEPPPGPPPGYRNSGASMNAAMSPLPSAPNQGVGTSQPPSFRTERTLEGPAPEGRTDSPQPSNPDQSATEGEKAFKDLLTKYKNVKRLYFDGKSQIEGLSSQVEQLQNAVANQRMSQSRTALDDNEYATRFNRLNGAINNLSFNIRKDWRTVPQWLEKFVSADALKTGKQEMTAVGRAVITRWLVEEVFNKCFHPGLDPTLSAQLKEIELSIRGNAYNMQSQEEYDALTTRIVNWRMATLDGLQRRLTSSTTGDNRNMLISKATTTLTTCLYQYLSNPPPPGVEGSTSMIVELAVGIAANLPLESRDVAIMYPLPGDPVLPHLMEIEKMGLPTLEAHRVDADLDVDDELDKERAKARIDKAKANALAAMGGQGSRKGSLTASGDGEGLPKDAGIVRFAGFMALEVRGRQVLMKAPVWTL